MVSESVKTVMDAEQAAAAAVEKAKEDAKAILGDARADGERVKAEAAKRAAEETEAKLAQARRKAEETAAKGAVDAAADVKALESTVEGRFAEAKQAALKVFMK